MDDLDRINAIFRENLVRMMAERGLTPARLSQMANLNARAVTDIRDGRSQSPKLSTAYSLAQALGVDMSELLGLPGPHMTAELHRLLSRYDAVDQARIADALRALPLRPPPEE